MVENCVLGDSGLGIQFIVCLFESDVRLYFLTLFSSRASPLLNALEIGKMSIYFLQCIYMYMYSETSPLQSRSQDQQSKMMERQESSRFDLRHWTLLRVAFNFSAGSTSIKSSAAFSEAINSGSYMIFMSLSKRCERVLAARGSLLKG